MKLLLIILAGLGFGYAFIADRKIGERNQKIRELEFENRMLKLDKHADSIVRAADITFRKQLDSIFRR